MSTRASSRVLSVDIRAHTNKRWSLNVMWRSACACVMSPNQFETTFPLRGFQWNWFDPDRRCKRTRLNGLDLDLWCRPLALNYIPTSYSWICGAGFSVYNHYCYTFTLKGILYYINIEKDIVCHVTGNICLLVLSSPQSPKTIAICRP